MKTKEDLKTVALGTSKINYLDPRITVAWCKRHEVPIEKVSVFTCAYVHKEGFDGDAVYSHSQVIEKLGFHLLKRTQLHGI